jgi:hypothetical protein
MILSHSKKFIFVHVYKVAGISIRQVLQPYHDMTAKDFPWYMNLKFKIGDRYQLFSDWAINHIRAREIKKYLPVNEFNEYFKFCFVRNPWDWQVSLYHFMLQYKKHPQHKLIANMKTFDEYIEWRIENDFELQKDFIYDENDNILMDFVGRFESLQEDFNEICLRLEIPTVELPYANKSSHKPFREYYNAHTIRLVREAFREDIELLNYDF